MFPVSLARLPTSVQNSGLREFNNRQTYKKKSRVSRRSLRTQARAKSRTYVASLSMLSRVWRAGLAACRTCSSKRNAIEKPTLPSTARLSIAHNRCDLRSQRIVRPAQPLRSAPFELAIVFCCVRVSVYGVHLSGLSLSTRQKKNCFSSFILLRAIIFRIATGRVSVRYAKTASQNPVAIACQNEYHPQCEII